MDRGQAFTLEAFTAALLLVSGVIFALQATAVTPLSASTSNQHIQNQQRLAANDLLAAAEENGSLRDAVVYWNTTTEAPHNATNAGYYADGGPPMVFGEMLDRTFKDEQIAFNVYLGYWNGNETTDIPMVFMGSPSDNAVAASRALTLYNDTRLRDVDNNPTGTTVAQAAAAGEFYAPDAALGSPFFNIVEVRIVVWRM